MILLILEEGKLVYKEYDGDFSPPGYAPPCSECDKTRTMFSVLISSWICTDCGTVFELNRQKTLQEKLDEVNLILEKLK